MSSVEAPMFLEQNSDFKMFDLCRKILYWQGFWHDEDEEAERDIEFYLKYFSPRLAHLLVKHRFLRLTFRLFRWFNPWFLIITFYVQVFFFFPVGMYVYKNNTMDVFGNFFGIINQGIVLTGMCSIYFQPKLVNSIFTELDVMLGPGELNNQEQRDIYDKTRAFCQMIVKHIQTVIDALLNSLVTFYYIFYLLPERRFFSKEWYPWDTTSSPAYEITLFIRFIQTIISVLVGYILISALAIGIILQKSNFKILNNKLENIRTISMNRIKARKLKDSVPSAEYTIVTFALEESQQVGMALQGGQLKAGPAALNARRVDNLALLRPLCRSGRAEIVPSAHLPQVGTSRDDQRGNASEGISTSELNNEMQICLKEDIQLHVKLIRSHGLCNKYLNGFLIVMFLANTVVLGVTAMLFALPEADEFFKILLAIICAQTAVIYLIVNNGLQLIADQHEAVCESVYNSDWTGASPSFKKSMLVIMSRANVPLVMKPTGLEPVSRKNFAQVMNGAYKMVNTLQAIIK